MENPLPILINGKTTKQIKPTIREIQKGDYIRFYKRCPLNGNVEYKNGDEHEKIGASGIVISVDKEKCEVKTKESDIHTCPFSDIIQIVEISHPSPKIYIIQDLLSEIWGKFVFRRVCGVVLSEDHHIGYRKTELNNNKFIYTKTDKYPDKFKENFHIQSCSNFYYGFSGVTHVRQSDPYKGTAIFFDRRGYNELDFTDKKTCWFGTDEKFTFSEIPPKRNQLICGLVGDGPKGPMYIKWWKCSYQFLRLWTFVCQPEHISLTQISNPNSPNIIPGGLDFRPREGLSNRSLDSPFFPISPERASDLNHPLDNISVVKSKVFNSDDVDLEFPLLNPIEKIDSASSPKSISYKYKPSSPTFSSPKFLSPTFLSPTFSSECYLDLNNRNFPQIRSPKPLHEILKELSTSSRKLRREQYDDIIPGYEEIACISDDIYINIALMIDTNQDPLPELRENLEWMISYIRNSG